MAQKTTILIVDDHALFREGLKAILSQETQYEVIGETGNGREALKLARSLKPELILLDMALPDRNGIELTREIRNSLPNIRIIIVSMHSKIDYIVQAFQAGATGYVVKESAFERLLQGIECVLKDECFMDSSVSHKVLEKLMRLPEKKTKITDAKYDSLTLREQEVMVLLAEDGQRCGQYMVQNLEFDLGLVFQSNRNKLNTHSTILNQNGDDAAVYAS